MVCVPGTHISSLVYTYLGWDWRSPAYTQAWVHTRRTRLKSGYGAYCHGRSSAVFQILPLGGPRDISGPAQCRADPAQPLVYVMFMLCYAYVCVYGYVYVYVMLCLCYVYVYGYVYAYVCVYVYVYAYVYVYVYVDAYVYVYVYVYVYGYAYVYAYA